MHITPSTQSPKPPSEQSGYWPSWGEQLCKSVILTTSGVGLGWLVSRLWKGADPQAMNHTDSGHQLAVYCKEQNDYHWTNTEFLSAVSMEVCAPRPDSESLFQKLDISYRDSVRNDAKSLGFSNPIPGASAAGFLVASLLARGSTQHASLTPAALGLLVLSMPGSTEAWNNDAVPIGSVIAYASDELPPGYLRCDGSMRSIEEYPELYEVLKEHCSKDGDYFKLPDYRGLFLRGAKETADLGKVSDDTTRMPRKEFHVGSSGAHVHTTQWSGQHDHISDRAGEHSHTLDPAGKHTHSVDARGGVHKHTVHGAGEHEHAINNNGQHVHAINTDGNHAHEMKPAGKHNHNKGEYQYLAKSDGQGTASSGDSTPGEPNLFSMQPIQWASDHVHEIKDNGRHTHTMKETGSHSHSMHKAGDHTHEMSDGGEHMHTLATAPPHTHKASLEASHSHTIGPAGTHAHDIAMSGEHIHSISGGDEETSPKNAKVVYLIKAKPERERECEREHKSGDSLSIKDFLIPLATSVAVVFVAKIRR